ncbi:MAG: primosomal protein N' [Deltaproteobacteria bacterium]|nr:primosomal protein N' [Deltaproteobacteria bacterium]
MFVKVAIPIPKDQSFDYIVPTEMEKDAAIGKRVLVPFGNKRETGCIVGITTATDIENPKEIIEVLDQEPLFDDRDLAFYSWTADYYLYPLGKVLGEILPGVKDRRARTEKVAAASGNATSTTVKLTKKQRLLLKILQEETEVSVADLCQRLGNVRSTLATLEKKGLACITEKGVSCPLPPFLTVGEPSGRPAANPSQEAALQEIHGNLQAGQFHTVLLHGVTGSGKTEVYFQAMEEVRRRRGGVIYLVPEIALTPQLITRLKERFVNENIAVLHSGVSRAVRYDQWQRLRRGEIHMAVGVRSALFAPVRDLKLIIVDEEHDASYKQDDRLPYSARDLAIVKGRLHGATVVLGSATPAVQTCFNARSGKFSCLTMPGRIADRPLPPVEIVDMKMEKAIHGENTFTIFSRRLAAAIRETLDRKQQVMLLLNRRGYHTFQICRDCGQPLKCRNCEVSLIQHAQEGVWKCHYCDYTLAGGLVCSRCSSSNIGAYGMGTELLEEEITNLFPTARIRRMDSDTMDRKGAHEQLLHALGQDRIDILVGTQMISKGHDFPNVTLVGVILADTSLNLPDFRAAERTFQLLTQVSGRGGRGDVPGKVIIQTFNPNHYAIQRARDHDYDGFYEEEISLRQSLFYPPFSRLIHLRLSCIHQDKGEEGINRLAAKARELLRLARVRGKVEIVGPAEAPLFRLRGRYRWQLLLKGDDSRFLHALTRDILSGFHAPGVQIKVDVDPVHFM